MLIQDSTLHFDLSSLRETILLDTKQEAFVRAALSSTHWQDLLAGLDAKIRETENALAELHKQRNATLETMAIHSALLAPVRRLPPEVLGEIFQRCVPMKPTHVTPFDSRDAPLLLTRICHRWRQVAQGTPLLWNKLVLYGRTPEVFFSSMWLNNSRSLPLDISVEEYPRGVRLRPIFWPAGDSNYSEDTEHESEMDPHMIWHWPEGVPDQNSQIVVGQLSRIRRFSLVCATDLGDYFQRESMTTFPFLQELCVNLTHFLGFPWMGSSFHKILTPQLQTLVLDGGAELLLPAFECTPNLRNLNIGESCTIESFVDFVSRHPALQRIVASGMEVPYPDEPMDTSHINLPELSHLELEVRYPSFGQSDNGLEIYDEGWNHRTKPLERLRTPNLQWAEIRSHPYCGRFLSNFIADSQSRLHTLKILYVKLDARTFNNATSIFTALERLEFLHCQSRAGFWESLIDAEDTPSHMWTFPKLRILLFDAGRMASEHEAEFVRFVERRAPPMRSHGQPSLEKICYLEEIKVIRVNFGVGTLSALERLRETREGFSITIEGESFAKYEAIAS